MQHAAPKSASSNSNRRKHLTLRRAVESRDELVFITDSMGVVQYVNSACEILTGYAAAEMVDDNIERITAELPKCESYESLRAKALEKGVSHGTIAFRCKNGSAVELQLAITVVLNPRTQEVMLACTGLALAQEQDVLAANGPAEIDPIGAFTRGIAHDFNNLLMVIGAYAEMGLAAVDPGHPVRRNLQEIQASVRRASDLSRRLLMLGRKTKGQQLISINWIIEDVASMLARIMEEDVEIRVSLGKNVGLVRADPGQMEEVLLNLAINARDAMPNGGELLIETHAIQLDEAFAKRHVGLSPGEYVRLTVTDTGRGIAPNELARIFEPYFTTKSEGKGTGLGLAIVQSIIQQSSGSISAISEPGVGTSINIYLPIAGQPVERTAGLCREQVSIPGGNESILVVEDDKHLRESMVEFLSSLGYEVGSASSGVEALKILQESRRALIVIDVVMPQMSGREIARAVASLRHRSRILFISGHAEDVVLRKGIDAGEANFLKKPFPLRSLATKIRELLDEPVSALAAAAAAGR